MDRRRIQELQRDMPRKDKALVETAALRVASKNSRRYSGGRGRMIPLNDRHTLAQNIRQVQAEGTCLHAACALAGIDSRTLQRGKWSLGLTHGDRRPGAVHKTPLIPQPKNATSHDSNGNCLGTRHQRLPRSLEWPLPGGQGWARSYGRFATIRMATFLIAGRSEFSRINPHRARRST